MTLKEAIRELKKGNFVLIHDSSEREDETDMVIAAEMVEPRHVAKLRRDGGGLICVAMHPQVAHEINLPYLTEIYKSAESNHEILDIAKADDLPYDARSAFSIYVNHRDTFTGITDEDRALTIRELGKVSSKLLDGDGREEFGKKFRTPGHVPLLRAADGLLRDRKGHTEYSVALMEMADLSPTSVVCEMLDEKTNQALDKENAKKYSEREDLVYLEGEEIVKGYNEWKGCRGEN